MLYFKIDENGKFVEPVLFDAPPMITKSTSDDDGDEVKVQVPDPQYVTKRPPNGLHEPTWNEEKQEWENGINDEEIEKKRKESKKEQIDESAMMVAEMTEMMAMMQMTHDAKIEKMQMDRDIVIAELTQMVFTAMGTTTLAPPENEEIKPK